MSRAALAQVNREPGHSAVRITEETRKEETTMRGCLGGRPRDDVYSLVADAGGYYYFLVGNTSILKEYVGKEVSLRGKDTGAVAPSTFKVTSLAKVFDVPCPTFKPLLSRAAWHTERSQKYGIEFSYPEDFTRTHAAYSGKRGGNFVTDQGVSSVGLFVIPGRIYPKSNFVGGTFSISVTTEIGNGPSCRQFGFSHPRFGSSHTFHGIHYSEMVRAGIAMGSTFSDYQFHTFQNGLCYEISFEFQELNPGNIEHKTRVLGQRDEWNLIRPLISRVQFSRPEVKPKRKSNPQAVPRITRFVASTQTANSGGNDGRVTFSWTTRDADYVALSYKCAPSTAGKIPAAVMLVEGSPCYQPGPSPNPKSVQYLPPNASHTLNFIGYRGLDPVPIIVKLMPYAYGKVYPDSARTLPIQVYPWNQFPEGVPAPDGRIALSYPVHADGSTKLQQGSTLTIHWRDVVSDDPCVNLCLVQDIGAGPPAYRMQLGNKCFAPASSGSYTWTIPGKFSGTGFKIYSRAPGGRASGLGTPFSIVPSTAGHRSP